MKVKVKKEGKVKEFKLINSWEDVTLEKWLQLIDFETGTKTEEATETIAALSNIPKQLVKELALSDVAVIMSRIAQLQQEQDTKLKRIIEIDGVEYGFHPDLDSITLGEYADIEKELNNYIYADKGSKLYVDNYNHAIDGVRYNVIYHLDNPNAGKYYVQ